ncbi:MAG: hypothetical protein ACO1O6_01165 [Bacteroidota bacterium]
MIVIISAQRTIYAIQDEFSKIFPYLKLDFYLKGLEKNNWKRIINPSRTIAECSPKEFDGSLLVTPGMTVAELEQGLETCYGLGVIVFRKSGWTWLETTFTGHWSLSRQNREGKMITRELGTNDHEENLKNIG